MKTTLKHRMIHLEQQLSNPNVAGSSPVGPSNLSFVCLPVAQIGIKSLADKFLERQPKTGAVTLLTPNDQTVPVPHFIERIL